MKRRLLFTNYQRSRPAPTPCPQELPRGAQHLAPRALVAQVSVLSDANAKHPGRTSRQSFLSSVASVANPAQARSSEAVRKYCG